MKSLRAKKIIGVVGVALLALPGVAAADPTWNVAFPAPPNAQYRGIAALSPNDAWATGFAQGLTSFVQHWDGTRWTESPPPAGDPCTQPGEQCVAGAIGASSTDNVFAVVVDASTAVGTIVRRWDGTRWTDLPTPDPPTGTFSFFSSPSLKVFSATDAWLAGTVEQPAGELTTIASHWDGARWTIFPTPNPDVHQNVLQAIAGSAPNDLWAGGYWTTGSGRNSVPHTLLLHFDGHAWTRVAAPDAATTGGPRVIAMVTPGAGEAWAGSLDGTLLHWNGVAWSTSATGKPTVAMTALSPSDVWAVPSTGGVAHHFDGHVWSDVTIPLVAPARLGATALRPPTPPHYEFSAAAAAGPGTLWFAGAHVTPTTTTGAIVSTSNG